MSNNMNTNPNKDGKELDHETSIDLEIFGSIDDSFEDIHQRLDDLEETVHDHLDTHDNQKNKDTLEARVRELETKLEEILDRIGKKKGDIGPREQHFYFRKLGE